MPVPLLDLKAQHATIRDDIVAAMMKVVHARSFILGEPVARLEQEVAALSHTKHAIGCASGTDALLLAFRALDIGRGDEVVTTPFTFFADGRNHSQCGRHAGVRGHRATDLQHRSRRGARGGDPLHEGRGSRGSFRPDGGDRARSRLLPSMPIVEDAAQTIGARRCIAGKQRMAGEPATIGTLSFFPSKNLGGTATAG